MIGRALERPPDPVGGPRVLLVCMPYAALERPAVGISLLKAILQQDGTACDVRYFGPLLADRIGVEAYRWVQDEFPYMALPGEWTFTQALYGDRPEIDGAYVEELLRGVWRMDEATIDRLRRIREACTAFVDDCLARVPWNDYDVVGFTSTFEQNLASLALARRVKEAHPGAMVVFGGANWEDEMGVAYHERFPFVDLVCSGEADESFPALLRALRAGEDLGGVKGIVHRVAGCSVATGPPELVRDLDALPVPAFDDFFDGLEASDACCELEPVLWIENSRGCWWGAKQHCTFCGLNGTTMTFRSKSPQRVIAEIKELVGRHGVRAISVTDNILDMRYFTTLLPMLEREQLGVELFFEVKANLTLAQVRQLWAAGVRKIQPGIESFSDRILALMRKGTTALQNIQLLKWCMEFGIEPGWNILYGFPGEQAEDYLSMLPLIDRIEHLLPPFVAGPIRLDRFSPYHADPGGSGMTNVRAARPYRFLYPFDDETLLRAAYYFDFDHVEARVERTYAGPLIERVKDWIAGGPRGELWVTPADDGSVAIERVEPDGRRGSVRLQGWQAAAYLACDRVAVPARILELAALEGVSADDLRGFFDALVEERLMATVGGRYLSVAVHTPPRTEPDRAELHDETAAGPEAGTTLRRWSPAQLAVSATRSGRASA